MRERDTETETENQILVQKGSALAYHTDTPIEPQSFPTDHLIFFLATTTYLPGGYGYSTGKPSEEGLVTDTLAAYGWLMGKASRGELDGSKVIVAGRSLGGAVAIAAAARLQSDAASSTTGLSYSPPAALVVENSFTSISAMVDAKFPFLNIPFFKEFFLRLKWDSLSTIRRLSLPILFLSSARDEIVPASQMVALHDAAAAASTRKFHLFSEATHNDISVKGGQDYWDAKRRFFAEFCG